MNSTSERNARYDENDKLMAELKALVNALMDDTFELIEPGSDVEREAEHLHVGTWSKKQADRCDDAQKIREDGRALYKSYSMRRPVIANPHTVRADLHTFLGQSYAAYALTLTVKFEPSYGMVINMPIDHALVLPVANATAVEKQDRMHIYSRLRALHIRASTIVRSTVRTWFANAVAAYQQ